MPLKCRRCHKVGHLYKECLLVKHCPPLEESTEGQANLQGTHEQSTPTSSGHLTTAKALEKQRGTNMIRPPSPPLTRSRVAAAAVLSSGNPLLSSIVNSITISVSLMISSFSLCTYKFSSTSPSLSFPLVRPSPIFSNTPSFPDLPLFAPLSEASDPYRPTHSYNLRYSERASAKDSCGIGIISPIYLQNLHGVVSHPSPKPFIKLELMLSQVDNLPLIGFLEHRAPLYPLPHQVVIP